MHNKDVITSEPFLPAAKAASVFIKILRFPPHSMAAATTTTTTKLIQVRPNHRCLSTFRLFSSSSSTPTPPPPDTDDIKPPLEPKSSIPQFSSYFSDVKATLNQSQSQPQMNPSFRPPAPNSSLSPPPPPKLPSLDEIGKTLRGFRHRTVPSSHPGPQPPSSFPQISFQDNLQRSVVNSRSLGGSSLLNDEKPRTPNLNFSSIRESFNQLKLTTVNNPKLNKSMSEYQQSLKSRPPSIGGIDSNNIVTDSLPFSVFGKETGYAEDDNPAMRTEFVRYYSVKELGDELKSLRPEKKKGDNKDWFSLDELNERLAKLRQMEMEKDKTNVSTKHFEDLKFVLSEMKLHEHDKAKKESMQRLESRDILSRHGRTPSFMLEPPKEELVEKYFHPDNMSASEKLKLELQKVRDEFKMSETDCGSARVQVAQLTTKINHLASVLHKKDKHSRKGLQGMLQKRKSLLKYLRRTDWESYSFVLSRLGLRDNPEIKR